MGCDIHIVVERRVKGKWKPVNPPEEMRDKVWLEIAERTSDEKTKAEYRKYWETKWPSRRNYSLFAILADVRNEGYLKPLAEPRGLPSDLGKPIDSHYSYGSKSAPQDHKIWLGDHSHSWFTLEDLMLVDWQADARTDRSKRGDDDFTIAKRTYKESADYVYKMIPYLHTLGLPEDVRIVFGFDN